MKTKLKLIECAKKEFIEKGYMKASLRNICSEAGVTTGAMYFFFKDKEELFESVVGGPLISLMNTIRAHFDQETDWFSFMIILKIYKNHKRYRRYHGDKQHKSCTHSELSFLV